MEHRRRERLPVGRRGFCRIDSDPRDEWLHCRLVDVSMLGLGIDVQHPAPTASIGRRITVEILPFGDSVNFRLEGSIREATRMRAGGTIRVRIAFGRLTTSERYMIDVLTWTEVPRRTA